MIDEETKDYDNQQEQELSEKNVDETKVVKNK